MRIPWIVYPLVFKLCTACVASHHPTQEAALGTPRRSAELVAVIDKPGPLKVETVIAADWKVDRAGLINLDHPRARAAHLEDGAEPVQIFFHVLRHPTRGTFIIDTGLERAVRDDPDNSVFGGFLVEKAMHREWLEVRLPLGDWLTKEAKPLQGVLLTHLHLDHIAGLPDLPAGPGVYAGPGETSARAAMNLLGRGIT
ncbi:MAG TPA: MBL fold metallo-hydrolase, partial [Myxococcaceae bacterium]|nr:MBL fold metallo-hydrolase [Myxococcaceae bacterium]